MCFAPLPNALRPLHLNLSKFQFSSFLTFSKKTISIWWSKSWRGVLRDEFLVTFWVQNDHISSQNFSGTVELPSRNHTQVFWKYPQTPFSLPNLSTRGVLRDEFSRPEKFFHRKVWNLENIFHMYNVFISPIVQKIFTLLGKHLPH